MSALIYQRSRTVLQALVQGVDPELGLLGADQRMTNNSFLRESGAKEVP